MIVFCFCLLASVVYYRCISSYKDIKYKFSWPIRKCNFRHPKLWIFCFPLSEVEKDVISPNFELNIDNIRHTWGKIVIFYSFLIQYQSSEMQYKRQSSTILRHQIGKIHLRKKIEKRRIHFENVFEQR